jgi:CheY-like chemotaxis protein/two-component sensor histidine kinase
MEVIGTMAGGIAHDFNNLLTIISGNLEFIEHQHDIEDHLKENLEHIRIATERAKQLTKQILTFSRRNECELVPTIFSVAIDEALRLLCSTTPVTVEIIKAVDNGAIINADMTQLQQVLINLCTNSVYAMNEKGVLRVSLEEVEFELGALHLSPHQKAGRYAMLSVSDTGCGMEQMTVSKIFDPFFTTKDVGEGTGMGLSVVHGIVEHHDGFISVESKPGEGSTFNIYFPVITGIETEQRTGITTALPTGTENILFVDDEEGVASICKKLLERQGYQVTSLTSSFKALDIFKENPEGFDLVFTDQSMPEMSGTELAVELLKIRPDIPIILCSGYCSRVPEADYKAMGVREFCMKPMGVEQLATVARRVLDKGGRLT